LYILIICMNKFQKNLHYLTNVVILLFVYAVNFNIFNELLGCVKHALKHDLVNPNFVEMIESNYLICYSKLFQNLFDRFCYSC